MVLLLCICNENLSTKTHRCKTATQKKKNQTKLKIKRQTNFCKIELYNHNVFHLHYKLQADWEFINLCCCCCFSRLFHRCEFHFEISMQKSSIQYGYTFQNSPIQLKRTIFYTLTPYAYAWIISSFVCCCCCRSSSSSVPLSLCVIIYPPETVQSNRNAVAQNCEPQQ